MIGLLAYNEETNRIGLLKNDLWINDGFHCGRTMKVQINDEWIDTRLEMNCDDEWYLVGTDIVGNEAFLYLKAEV